MQRVSLIDRPRRTFGPYHAPMDLRHTGRAFLLMALIGLFSSCQAQSNDKGERIARYLEQAHARGQFNGVALVYEKGKVIYEGAFGIGNIDPVDSLTMNSVFRLGSVGKQFTAMAIMILQEHGKLRYDQDIRDFLPELPYAGITVRHLLHHTSGLPDYERLMSEQWKPELKYDDPARYISGNADVLRLLAEKKPAVLFAPGDQWKYSNTGYNLLASIVERASGQPFPAYVREHILLPAGMVHSLVYDYVIGPDPALPERVFGHWTEWNGHDRKSTDGHYLNRAYGEDGVYATAGDLLLWDRALYTEKLVKKATLEEAFTPGVLNNGDTTEYGFGWFIQRAPSGRKLVTHSGGWAGFTTYILRGVEEDLCIVVLTNNSSKYFGWEGIRGGITRILYNEPYALPKLSIRDVVGQDLYEHGAAHAIAQYRTNKQERPADFLFQESELNILGYELLWAQRVDDAAAIMKLNTEEYPNSANVYDSYGDALLAQGDKVNALTNFRRALVLDATMDGLKEKIDGLEKAK